MLFAVSESLDDVIVHLLALRPGLSAEAILSSLPKKDAGWGIHAVYKQIRKLIKLGVVVKQGSFHYLRAHWVADYLDIASGLEQNYLSHSSAFPLPESGQRLKWTFTDLARLNDFSSSILLHMCRASTDSRIFTWHPHSWFWLVQPLKEQRHWEQLQRQGAHRYIVVGGSTALDRWISQQWGKGVTCKLGGLVPGLSEGRYVMVASPYILWIWLDPASEQAIELMFKRSKGGGQVDAASFMAAFRSKSGKKRLVIENNEKRCKTIELHFSSYFGFQRKPTKDCGR